MKIAVSSQGTDLNARVEPRFGRSPFFVIIDEETGEVTFLDNRANASAGHGAGPNTASAIADAGVQVVLTGNGPGGNAGRVLSSMGIAVYAGVSGTVKDAYDAYKANKLTRVN